MRTDLSLEVAMAVQEHRLRHALALQREDLPVTLPANLPPKPKPTWVPTFDRSEQGRQAALAMWAKYRARKGEAA